MKHPNKNQAPNNDGLNEAERRVLQRMNFDEETIREIERDVIDTERWIALHTAGSAESGNCLVDHETDVRDHQQETEPGEDDEEFEANAESVLAATEKTAQGALDDQFRSPAVVEKDPSAMEVWRTEGLGGFILSYGAAFVDVEKTNYTFLHWRQIADVLMELELRPVLSQEQIEELCSKELLLPSVVFYGLTRFDFYYVGRPEGEKRRIAAEYATLRHCLINYLWYC